MSGMESVPNTECRKSAGDPKISKFQGYSYGIFADFGNQFFCATGSSITTA